MLALPRRQEQHELVRADGEFEGRDEGHRGLSDPGRRVGQEVAALFDRLAGIREEVRLALADSIEGPRDPDGGRAHGDGGHERFQDQPPQGRRHLRPGRYEGLPEGESRKYSGGFRAEIIMKQRLRRLGELLSLCDAGASSAGSGRRNRCVRGATRSSVPNRRCAPPATRRSKAGLRPATRAARP